MGSIAFLYAALVGFFAFASLYHLILWWSSRREIVLAVFSAMCGLLAALSGVLATLLTSESIAVLQSALRFRIAVGILMMIAWLWSLLLVSGVRARWFAWPVTAVFAILFIIHTLIVPLNATVVSVERYAMPWGEMVSNPQLGPAHWWLGPMFALAFANFIFGLVCGYRVWIHDRVAGLLILVAGCGLILNVFNEVLRAVGKPSFPIYGGVIAQVPWVCVIAVLIAREHRRTREKLAASEQRFRGIFDQTFQFIGLLKTDGTLIEVNRTALEFAGIREDDVIGKPLWETPWWAHSTDMQSRLRAAILAAATGRTVRFEGTHPRADGRIAHIDFSLKPICNEAGLVTLLIPEGRDITELKHAEEERRILESQLAQAQKMEAIGKLAGGVAHDFNNLLTVIYGYGELLLSMAQPNAAMCTMVDGILDAGDRAAALTRQLLTFTRLQVVEPRVIDLNAVVAESEGMLRRLIGEDMCLVTELDPELALAKADPGQIGQVIINLAVNARDAMPTGGKLTIATANVDIDESVQALHPQATAERHVMLSVTDTGSGMTPEIQSRIFEPFFTTKDTGKGTGLGLTTVRTIAEESGGFLSVSSEPGRGATFQMYLPALAAMVPAKRPDTNVQTVPHGNETILLVEDEETVRALTCRILQQLGYTVVAAFGGAEAIRLIEQRVEPIDLLVTDVVMPEMDGRKLAERLTLRRPGLKVLYLSGYTDDAVVRHGVLQADVAFLQKPFTIEALAGKVRQTLDLPVKLRKQTG